MADSRHYEQENRAMAGLTTLCTHITPDSVL